MFPPQTTPRKRIERSRYEEGIGKRIEPELAEVFPDTESVNRVLGLLADTAEAAASPARRVRRERNKRVKRNSGKTGRFAVR